MNKHITLVSELDFAVMCVIYLKLHHVYSVTEKTSKYIVANEIQMFFLEERITDKERREATMNSVMNSGLELEL